MQQSSSPTIHWLRLTFSQLSVAQLYAILQLRAAVFVVEQQCIYQDMDGLDQQAEHVLGYIDHQLVAYLRIYVKDQQVVIGRVLTSPEHRGQGIGKQLIAESLLQIRQHAVFSTLPVIMFAQTHLQDFYRAFGFVSQGAPFDEDGIPHILMVMPV